jgi:hypothetical protein
LRERNRRYRKEHPEKERERNRRYRKEHPEKDRERKRHYREKNRELAMIGQLLLETDELLKIETGRTKA